MEEKQTMLTEDGYKELQKKLDYLIGTRRNEVAKRIEVARGFGDLSENAEYDEAKKEQAQLEEEIVRLTKVLNEAVVVADSDISTSKVSLGVTVIVEDAEDGEKCEYTLVGAEEADPDSGKISNECPIGAGLMNKSCGQIVEIQIPSGTVTYKILEIKH